MINEIRKKRRLRQDIERYSKMGNEDERFPINRDKLWAAYNDDEEAAASRDEHYFLQDIYIARKVSRKRPMMHYDIGSRIDGFIAHLLSADIKVTMLDIRPFSIEVDGLKFVQTDATTLNGIKDASIDSISSLHAIEHFGLGRYGDPIDPNAWEKALKSIQKKVRTNGVFYLSVPIGVKEEVCFNLHRIFHPRTIINTLDEMVLESFEYIHDYRIISVNIDKIDEETNLMGEYDCGLFCFIKK